MLAAAVVRLGRAGVNGGLAPPHPHHVQPAGAHGDREYMHHHRGSVTVRTTRVSCGNSADLAAIDKGSGRCRISESRGAAARFDIGSAAYKAVSSHDPADWNAGLGDLGGESGQALFAANDPTAVRSLDEWTADQFLAEALENPQELRRMQSTMLRRTGDRD